MNQTTVNLFSNLLNLLVSVLITLLYTPYLVNTLGVSAYGVLPLALIINQFVAVVTGSLTGSLTRFYTIEVQNGNYNIASKYMSSVLILLFAITIILMPCFYFIINRIDLFFNIPQELIESAKSLFFFTLCSFVVSLYSSLLNVSLYSQNRLDLMNLIKILRNGLKCLFVIIFFSLYNSDIKYIGIANFLAEGIVLGVSYMMFKRTSKITPIYINTHSFDKRILIPILAMSSWVIIHQVGDMGLYRLDSLVLNLFWSTDMSGILNIFSEVGTYITVILAVVSSLYGPHILIAYAKNDKNQIANIILNSTMIIGIMGAIIVGCILPHSQEILSTWFNSEIAMFYKWMNVKLIILPFMAAAAIYGVLFRSHNYVKVPALFVISIGVINLIASYIICNASNGNMNYILYMLIISAGLVLLQSFIFGSYYFLKEYKTVTKRNIVMIFLKILVTLVLSSAISSLFGNMVSFSNIWLSIIVKLIIPFIGSSFIAFIFIMSKDNRTEFIKLIYNK